MSRFEGIRRVFRLGVERGETAEELAFHREQTREELVARGLSPEEVEAEMRRRFGDEHRWRREIEAVDRGAERRRRWGEGWEVVSQSVRLALRRMRREPGFTAAVVLTFALGIGANATMFGIVDRLLLSPPAHVAHPEQVKHLAVDAFDKWTNERRTNDVLSYPDFEAFARASSFSSVAAYTGRKLTLGRGEGAREVSASLVSGSFFSTLGVRPALGRFFGPAEDEKGAAGAAVLSYGFWQSHFGGDPAVIGKVLDFGIGTKFTVVGIAPRGFTGAQLEAEDVWLPLRTTLYAMGEGFWFESDGSFFLSSIARLAPAVSEARAEAEATSLYRAVHSERIERGDRDPESRVVAAPLVAGRGPLAPKEAKVARWLAAISFIVLLIACANVTNLLLARAARRRSEVAVRVALGSSRSRLMGQVIVESALLALRGGLAALLVAWWGGGLLEHLLLPDIAWSYPGAGTRLAVVVLGLTLLAALAAALIPACQASRPKVTEVLKSGSRSLSAPGSRTRATLTVLQTTLSVMLLVGSGLFVRSLQRVRGLDLGIDPQGAYLVTPTFEKGISDAEMEAFYARAAERLRTLPGVQHAAYSRGIPFRTGSAMSLRVPGVDSLPRLPGGGPYYHAVSGGYFSTLGLGILRGRALTDADREDSQPVVVVSATMARLLWPGQNALGRCMMLGDSDQCATVVGVAEDSRRFSLVEDAAMEFYLPAAQYDGTPQGLLVRAEDGSEGIVPAVQRELLATSPRLRFAAVQSFEDILNPQASTWRLGAVVFTAFGLLALLVAAVGLYGVLAFSVAQRTFELGIRSALGASRERLLRLVLSQALRLVVVGVVLGLVAALLAGRWMEPLLFRTSPHDPLVLAGVAGALLLVGVLASWLPARRATRVDPSTALRAE